MGLQIRKLVAYAEEIRLEAGQPVSPVLRKAVAAAVIRNPLAGRFQGDLDELIGWGAELGGLLSERVIAALGAAAESYGKSAIVGMLGEIEHGGALIHPRLGKPFRAALGGGKAIIPSSVKRGGPGTSIDIPLHGKDDAWSFDHFDAVELRIPDAPAPDEIVVAIAAASRGRPLARLTQLAASDTGASQR